MEAIVSISRQRRNCKPVVAIAPASPPTHKKFCPCCGGDKSTTASDFHHQNRPLTALGNLEKVCEFRPLSSRHPSFSSLPGCQPRLEPWEGGVELRSVVPSFEGPVEFRQVVGLGALTNLPTMPQPSRGNGGGSWEQSEQKRHQHERARRASRSGRARASISGRGESRTPSRSRSRAGQTSPPRRNGSFPDLSRIPPPDFRSLPHQSDGRTSRRSRDSGRQLEEPIYPPAPPQYQSSSRHIQTETAHVHHHHHVRHEEPGYHERVHFGTVVPYERRLHQELQDELRQNIKNRRRSKSVSSTSRRPHEPSKLTEKTRKRPSHRQPSLSPTRLSHPPGEHHHGRRSVQLPHDLPPPLFGDRPKQKLQLPTDVQPTAKAVSPTSRKEKLLPSVHSRSQPSRENLFAKTSAKTPTKRRISSAEPPPTVGGLQYSKTVDIESPRHTCGMDVSIEGFTGGVPPSGGTLPPVAVEKKKKEHKSESHKFDRKPERLKDNDTFAISEVKQRERRMREIRSEEKRSSRYDVDSSRRKSRQDHHYHAEIERHLHEQALKFEQEQKEKARLEKERKERELARIKKEKEKIEQENRELEERRRREREKFEAEEHRRQQEQRRKEQAEKERRELEEQRLAKEAKFRKEKLDREREEREKRLAEAALEKQKEAMEKAQKERLLLEQEIERERLAMEMKEKERVAREMANQERKAIEKAERDRRLRKQQREDEKRSKRSRASVDHGGRVSSLAGMIESQDDGSYVKGEYVDNIDFASESTRLLLPPDDGERRVRSWDRKTRQSSDEIKDLRRPSEGKRGSYSDSHRHKVIVKKHDQRQSKTEDVLANAIITHDEPKIRPDSPMPLVPIDDTVQVRPKSPSSFEPDNGETQESDSGNQETVLEVPVPSSSRAHILSPVPPSPEPPMVSWDRRSRESKASRLTKTSHSARSQGYASLASSAFGLGIDRRPTDIELDEEVNILSPMESDDVCFSLDGIPMSPSESRSRSRSRSRPDTGVSSRRDHRRRTSDGHRDSRARASTERSSHGHHRHHSIDGSDLGFDSRCDMAGLESEYEIEQHIRHCRCPCDHMGHGNYLDFKVGPLSPFQAVAFDGHNDSIRASPCHRCSIKRSVATLCSSHLLPLRT